MLSNPLIRMIEDHWERITLRAVSRLRQDPDVPNLRRLTDSELQEWGRGVLKNLSQWLVQTRDQQVVRRYENLGRVRFEEAVPLYEVVRGIQILKDETIDFARGQGFGPSVVEVYAEEELEHRLDRFFDWLVYHLVRGYEEALRKAAHLAA